MRDFADVMSVISALISFTIAHVIHIIAVMPLITARLIIILALMSPILRVMSVMTALMLDILGVVPVTTRIMWLITTHTWLISGVPWLGKSEMSDIGKLTDRIPAPTSPASTSRSRSPQAHEIFNAHDLSVALPISVT